MTARAVGTVQPPHGATVRFALAASIQTGTGPYMLAVRYWDGTGFWSPFDWAQGYTTRTQAGDALESALNRPTASVTDKDEPRLVRVWANGGKLIRATHGQGWEDLGARLRRARQAADTTHARAATAAGIARSAVFDIEAGRRKAYAEEYARLCRLYDVDADETLSGLPTDVRERVRSGDW